MKSQLLMAMKRISANLTGHLHCDQYYDCKKCVERNPFLSSLCSFVKQSITAKEKRESESLAQSVEVTSRDALLDAAKEMAGNYFRRVKYIKDIASRLVTAIAAEEARQAAWLANGKKPNRSTENLSIVTGVPMDQLERYLGGSESVKLSAYKGALEAFKREALCGCESSGKACLLCFERNPNEHNLCTSLRNLIAKEEENKS